MIRQLQTTIMDQTRSVLFLPILICLYELLKLESCHLLSIYSYCVYALVMYYYFSSWCIHLPYLITSPRSRWGGGIYADSWVSWNSVSLVLAFWARGPRFDPRCGHLSISIRSPPPRREWVPVRVENSEYHCLFRWKHWLYAPQRSWYCLKANLCLEL